MELHGVKHEEASPEGMSLADVGREVRVVSPLLMDKLERIRRLVGKDGSGDMTESQSTGLLVSGVPVEGTAVGAELTDGVASPLLAGSAHERMVSGLMRMGQQAVKRAQMDGAEMAIDSIPAARIGKR